VTPPPSPAPPSSLEAERVGPYLVFLFVLLSTATLFDGFDSAMLTVAAPDARATLDISREEWGVLFAFNRLGMVGSFFFLLFADRFGRRHLLMLTVVGFTVFNLLTAFASDKVEFAVFQFFARLFLTAEYALAVIVIGEEFPARLRGVAIAILTSFATLGVMAIAKVHPYILLEACAAGSVAAGDCVAPASNWVRDAGHAFVAAGQDLLGQPRDGEDWRVLYALGGVPLLFVTVLRLGMRETRRFEALRVGRDAGREGVTEVLRREWRNARIPFGPEYRWRSALVALLWNCVHLVTAPAVAFWVIYAREDLGFTPHRVGDILFWGYGGGVAGSYLAGFLLDRVGRKPVCATLYVFAAVSIFLLFQVRSVEGQYLWMIATVFGFGAANTATHVYASELFPTALRATGYGWTTNLFGRVTEVGVPLAVGAFVGVLGLSWSVGMVAFGPVLGAALVWRYAPETKGLTLEEIEDVAKRVGRRGAPALRRAPAAGARSEPGSG
jgi:putative MFS transporter